MSDVFVSYKAEDRRRVALLVEALETEGLSVWWDARIGGGEAWRQSIEAELDRARCVIVIWSKGSIGPKGSFVRDEASLAMERGTYLPVTIAPVRPPLGFRERQAVDLQRWQGDRCDSRYQAVLTAVRERIAGNSGSSPRPPMPRGISRRLALTGGAAAAAATAVGAWILFKPETANADSIAVLPFANLSGDPAQAYFSDGIAEELRNALSRIPGLSVVARTSSELVRDVDATTAARKLHVANILAGSVRRSPKMLRISAQLIDGTNGTERWSETYDRPIGDSLQIQGEIANMVAQALSIHLGADEKRALKAGGTENSEAQDLLLHAQAIIWRSDDKASLNRAMGFVDRALSLDPNYADALTAKASILDYLGSYLASSAADMQATGEAAERNARKAVSIAPRSGQAHATLAGILWSQLRLREGLAEYAKMETLPATASSFFSGFDSYATALAQCRRFEDAFDRAERLIATDPLNPNSYSTKSIVLGHWRRYPEADEAARQAMALGPDLAWPRALHGYCLMQTGRTAEAQEEFTALGGTGPWLAWAAILAGRQGQDAEASRIVSLMHESMGDGGNYQYAQVFAQQGRTEEAVAALERGWKARDPGLAFMSVDAMLDPLRNDPRFQVIVKRLNIPT